MRCFVRSRCRRRKANLKRMAGKQSEFGKRGGKLRAKDESNYAASRVAVFPAMVTLDASSGVYRSTE